MCTSFKEASACIDWHFATFTAECTNFFKSNDPLDKFAPAVIVATLMGENVSIQSHNIGRGMYRVACSLFYISNYYAGL